MEKMNWKSRILDPRRQKNLKIRKAVESQIRANFDSLGFTETGTPTFVPSPGMETHIKPFEVTPFAQSMRAGPIFLPTSPEFAMKKLLVGGLEKIYQIAKVYRDEPRSSTHLPEFTMLEWYRANADLHEIMRDCENLIVSMSEITSHRFNFSTPWRTVTVNELWIENVGIDLREVQTHSELAQIIIERSLFSSAEVEAISPGGWDDLFFLVWLNYIEPKFDPSRPLFVTHYPKSQAALAETVTDKSGFEWANRFELYLGGYELANAFQELTCADTQLMRFENDMKTRDKLYGSSFPKTPIDHDFIDALREGLPKSAGIALGVDRLIMALSGETEIGMTLWIEPFSS